MTPPDAVEWPSTMYFLCAGSRIDIKIAICLDGLISAKRAIKTTSWRWLECSQTRCLHVVTWHLFGYPEHENLLEWQRARRAENSMLKVSFTWRDGHWRYLGRVAEVAHGFTNILHHCHVVLPAVVPELGCRELFPQKDCDACETHDTHTLVFSQVDKQPP